MSIGSDDDSFLADDEGLLATEEEASIDYYAILNVARDASIEEINKAYKHRCLIFHPDRHIKEEDQKEAAKTFVILRKAHETLIDPQQRAIYDTVGIQGLLMQGWQLAERSSNPEHIRKEYDFLKSLRDHEIMLQRIHPASTFALRASACGLFQLDPIDRYPPHFIGVSMSQSVESAMTSNDKITLLGRARVSNGRGDGSIAVGWKKTVARDWQLEMSTSFSADDVSLATKLQKLLTPRSVCYIQPMLSYQPLYNQLNPSVMLVYTMQLQPNWLGTIALNYGLQNCSLITSVVRSELNHPKFIANFTLAPVNPSVRFSYYKRYPQNDFHYETTCTINLIGFSPTFAFERRLSRYSKIGAVLAFDFPSCLLQATFRLKTSLHNYEFKLLLCDNKEYVAQSAMYGVLLPMMLVGVAKLVFRRPLAKFMRLFEDRLDNDQVNERRKEEAQRIVHLMRGAAERIARDEERKGGVVIVQALYGQLQNDIPGAEHYPVAGEKIIDVTIPVQALVHDSQLRIYSTKDQLSGFYDPCPGMPKMLKVVYRFHGDLHAVTVFDDQALNIPLRAHFVGN